MSSHLQDLERKAPHHLIRSSQQEVRATKQLFLRHFPLGLLVQSSRIPALQMTPY